MASEIYQTIRQFENTMYIEWNHGREPILYAPAMAHDDCVEDYKLLERME